MKAAGKKILHRIFLNRFSWFIIKPFVFIAERLKAAKKFSDNESAWLSNTAIANQVLKSDRVLHGPFKGMKYHHSMPTGSSYYAKVLGSYEAEIHPFLNEVLRKKYDLIVDVGCDDGYYAVGLALKLNTPVIAFDLNKKALQQCKNLAELNNVLNLLTLREKCTARDLWQIEYNCASLMIVDCEGDEQNLFTEEVVKKLENVDLIIELHLHIHPEILQYLSKLFLKSHHISIAESVDDHKKVMTYNYDELQGLSYSQKKFILEEREIFMQWVYFTAIKSI